MTQTMIFRTFIAWFIVWITVAAGGITTASGHEPLPLDEVIKLAMEGAPIVLNAQDGVRDAELELDRAESAFRSTLSLGSDLQIDRHGSRTSATAQATGSIGASISWSARTSTTVQTTDSVDSLTVSYQLWPPAIDSSASVGLENARRRLETARYELDIARARAALSALDLYYKVLLATERLRLAEELLLDAQNTLIRIEERVASGRASAPDRITAEIELLEREGDIALRQNQLDQAKAELARLIGRRFVEISSRPLEEESLVAKGELSDVPSEAEATQAALAASAQLQARELAVNNAVRSVEIAQRNRGLGLSLNGGIESRQSGTRLWSVRLVGSYALSDGGARRRNILSAQHALERAQKAYDQEVDTIQEQVRSALRAIENGLRTVEIRRGMEELRQRDVSVAKQQADMGYITDAELRERRRASRIAMLDRVEAEVALQLERLRLDLLMGRTDLLR